VCRTSDLEIDWGYVKQVAMLGDRQSRGKELRLAVRAVSMKAVLISRWSGR